MHLSGVIYIFQPELQQLTPEMLSECLTKSNQLTNEKSDTSHDSTNAQNEEVFCIDLADFG